MTGGTAIGVALFVCRRCRRGRTCWTIVCQS